MRKSQETICVEAGEKIEIFNCSFSSVPMKYEFSAKAIESKPLSGLLEIQSKQILFSSPKKIMDLKESNVVKASLWDTFMTIYVIAGCDMEITVSKRSATSLKRISGLVIVLTLIAASLVLLK